MKIRFQNGQMQTSGNPKITGLVFLVVGIAMAAGSLFGLFRTWQFYNTAVETVAVITDIQTHGSGEDLEHEVYIRFTTQQGEEIHTELRNYSSSMVQGGQVTVFYDPEDPAEVMGQSQGFLAFGVPGILGAGTAIAGGKVLQQEKKKAWEEQ